MNKVDPEVGEVVIKQLRLLKLPYCTLQMTGDLEDGLDGVKSNLINFVFAALTLGLTCSRTTSQHTSFRGVVTSLLHEGMPMVIYSQILIWGQSTCCLLVLCVLNIFNAKIPSLFAAMVPLGVEAGEDVVVVPVYNNFWSQTVVQEAESLGLVAACLTGIVLISCKPFFMSRGWLGTHGMARDSSFLNAGSGQAEAFERAPKRLVIPRSSSVGNLDVDAVTRNQVLGDEQYIILYYIILYYIIHTFLLACFHKKARFSNPFAFLQRLCLSPVAVRLICMAPENSHYS